MESTHSICGTTKDSTQPMNRHNRCIDMAFDTQLDASGEVGRAEVADTVAVCIGWSQPMHRQAVWYKLGIAGCIRAGTVQWLVIWGSGIRADAHGHTWLTSRWSCQNLIPPFIRIQTRLDLQFAICNLQSTIGNLQFAICN